MKRSLLLIATLALVGCPPDVYAPSIPGGGNGSIEFKLDSFTCKSSYSVTFSADNVTLGTETLAPNGTSTVYQIGAGIHTVGAHTASGTPIIWPNANISITQNSKYTHVLTC